MVGRLAAVLILLAGCAAPKPPPNPSVSSADLVPVKGRGHDLVVLAASCWMNGLWSDAAGDRVESRERATHERCKRLLATIDRPSEDEDALRLVDPRLVDATVRQLWRTALSDKEDAPHARELVTLLEAVAGASREMVHAHRLVDAALSMPPEQQQDRTRAGGTAQALRDCTQLRALLRTNGPYASEAQALGLVFALDRMDVSRELPRALKLDALSGVLLEVFRVSAPKPNGSEAQWADYLGEVAKAAGHVVPATSSREVREALAWDAVLTAFAERLRATNAPGTVGEIARGAADRVDAAHVR